MTEQRVYSIKLRPAQLKFVVVSLFRRCLPFTIAVHSIQQVDIIHVCSSECTHTHTHSQHFCCSAFTTHRFDVSNSHIYICKRTHKFTHTHILRHTFDIRRVLFHSLILSLPFDSHGFFHVFILMCEYFGFFVSSKLLNWFFFVLIMLRVFRCAFIISSNSSEYYTNGAFNNESNLFFFFAW